MAEVYNVIEKNCTTGEEIIRPMTEEEIAQREADVAAFAAEQARLEALAEAETQAKESAQAKLAALGLTPEEIAALTK